jgi:ubiquinol-cytochrome c reductase cytochrome b subunit
MFEWLKFWEGPWTLFGVIIVPGVLALLLFLLPFLDRGLERRPWRRPLPFLGVAIVLVGMLFLGFKSHVDDAHDPAVAAQLATQAQEERAYTEAPFQEYVETGGEQPQAKPSGVVSKMSSAALAGQKEFQSHGCVGCHGAEGAGTARVPALGGLVSGKSSRQLSLLLHHPDAKMLAGGMPAFVGSQDQENSLVAYIRSLAPPVAKPR